VTIARTRNRRIVEHVRPVRERIGVGTTGRRDRRLDVPIHLQAIDQSGGLTSVPTRRPAEIVPIAAHLSEVDPRRGAATIARLSPTSVVALLRADLAKNEAAETVPREGPSSAPMTTAEAVAAIAPPDVLRAVDRRFLRAMVNGAGQADQVPAVGRALAAVLVADVPRVRATTIVGVAPQVAAAVVHRSAGLSAVAEVAVREVRQSALAAVLLHEARESGLSNYR
jgi:hypothetical protein